MVGQLLVDLAIHCLSPSLYHSCAPRSDFSGVFIDSIDINDCRSVLMDPTTLKEEGNRAFVAKDYNTALLKYDEALRAMDVINPSDAIRELQAVIHTNKSACNASLKKSVSFLRWLGHEIPVLMTLKVSRGC